VKKICRKHAQRSRSHHLLYALRADPSHCSITASLPSVRWCKPKEILFICRPLFKIVAEMHYSDRYSTNEPAKLLSLFPGGEVICTGRCFGCSLLSPALGRRWLNFYACFFSLPFGWKYRNIRCVVSRQSARRREGRVFKATLHEKHPLHGTLFSALLQNLVSCLAYRSSILRDTGLAPDKKAAVPQGIWNTLFWTNC